MRALVPLAVAAAVVVAPQAGSGGASAVAPEAIFVEPTAEKLASLEPAALPRTKIAAEVRRAEGGPAVVGDRRLWPALDAMSTARVPEVLHASRDRLPHRGLGGERPGCDLEGTSSFPPATAATTTAST